MTIKEYEDMTLAMLRAEAKKIGLEDFMELQKRELIIEILKYYWPVFSWV